MTKEQGAGSPVAGAGHPRLEELPAAALVHDLGEGRTLAATAASPGDAARMASRAAWSASASWPGLVMIQLVTALTFGGSGAAAGMAALLRKRAGRFCPGESCGVLQLSRLPGELAQRCADGDRAEQPR
ncbi:MAG TPA: hypothetical protein VE733_06500 [Streptosporangiaceae bacterium]|nr:hypothetical protein [Streptosporangiaceae bacterium]